MSRSVPETYMQRFSRPRHAARSWGMGRSKAAAGRRRWRAAVVRALGKYDVLFRLELAA